MIMLLLKGALLGFIITAPPGPIGTLCINRALDRGFWSGFSVGLGTALGDSTYALVAVAGLAMFAKALASITVPLAIGGGLLLVWLGWQRLSSEPVRAADISARDFLRTTIATFFLTISNPATILSFGALFAGFGLADETGAMSAAMILAGVFGGSLVWWFALSATVTFARDRLSPEFTAGFGKASGYLLIIFGFLAIGTTGYSLLA
jgi:putative LysE/RhtB family amino acid efflux pump